MLQQDGILLILLAVIFSAAYSFLTVLVSKARGLNPIDINVDYTSVADQLNLMILTEVRREQNSGLAQVMHI